MDDQPTHLPDQPTHVPGQNLTRAGHTRRRGSGWVLWLIALPIIVVVGGFIAILFVLYG